MKYLATSLLALSIGLSLAWSAGASQERAAERAAVGRAVRDYVEGIYEVRPELIERGVHPALAKRGVYRPDGGTEYQVPSLMSYEQLVHLASWWNDGDRRRDDLTYDVEVLDVLDQTAAAKLTADWGIDYMHLIRGDGGWKIVHVLWQSHPPKPGEATER